MKFTELHIENFLAITKAEVSLADRGLVLIQGENLDDTSAKSNGAGKSSLADALCWTLYGETARGVTGDAVINKDAGKGTIVQVVIEDAGITYVVTRHRKHKTGKNALTIAMNDGKTVTDLTKGTDKLTQEVVNKVVGASRDVFRAAVYAGQEQMPDLPAMTDKHLKMLIEEASGVTLLEEAYVNARTRLSDAKVGHSSLTTAVEKTQERLEWIDEQIKDAETSAAAWQTAQKKRVADLKAEAEAHVVEVKRLNAEITKIDEPLIKKAIDKIDTTLAGLKAESDELHRLTIEETRADTETNNARAQLQLAKNLVSSHKDDLGEVEHKVGCPCDECGRPITENEIAAARKAARSRVETAEKQVADADKALNEALARQKKAVKAAADHQKAMTDPSELKDRWAKLQKALTHLGDLRRERDGEESQARSKAAQIKTIRAEENPHAAGIEKLKEQARKAGKQRDELVAKCKTAETDVELAEIVAKVFSPAGVRAHILDEVTPFLNTQTQRYLDTLSDGNIEATWSTLVKNAKGELREKFTIEVENGKGANSFAGLSGGEKRKVRIATALSLQDLVATRALKPIDLFIGDEIDDALDNAGLERLTTILEEKARERGSVFVISHNDLKDWVSQTLTVRKQAGKTELIEETV